MAKSVFVSHVEEDQAIALELANRLQSEGYSAWCYENDSVPGQKYLITTRQAINQCSAFVILISVHSMASHQIDREIEQAHDQAKPIIPVRLGVADRDYKARKELWAQAIGTTVSVPISADSVTRVSQRIAVGLEELGIKPSKDRQQRSGTLAEASVGPSTHSNQPTGMTTAPSPPDSNSPRPVMQPAQAHPMGLLTSPQWPSPDLLSVAPLVHAALDSSGDGPSPGEYTDLEAVLSNGDKTLIRNPSIACCDKSKSKSYWHTDVSDGLGVRYGAEELIIPWRQMKRVEFFSKRVVDQQGRKVFRHEITLIDGTKITCALDYQWSKSYQLIGKDERGLTEIGLWGTLAALNTLKYARNTPGADEGLTQESRAAEKPGDQESAAVRIADRNVLTETGPISDPEHGGLFAQFGLRSGIRDPGAASKTQEDANQAVAAALAEIRVVMPDSKHGSVTDTNSRRVFAKLRNDFDDASEVLLLSALEAETRNSDEAVRWKAVRCLSYIPHSNSDALRQYWLRESKYPLRRDVLEATSQLPAELACQLLAEIAKGDDESNLRCLAVSALVKRAGRDYPQYVIPTLEQALSDDSELVRDVALNKAAEIDPKHACIVARRFAGDGQGHTLSAVTRVLAEFGAVDDLRVVAKAFAEKKIFDYDFSSAVKKFNDRLAEGDVIRTIQSMDRESALVAACKALNVTPEQLSKLTSGL